jgi:protein-tyrosine phosphatase
MKEIIPGLFVGNGADYPTVQYNTNWSVISAAKEPWHREALGYTGRGAPKEDPEYLVAYRPRHMIMNLVDPNDAKWIPRELIDAALDEIVIKLDDGFEVLVHCNQGESRAPSIVLLYLLSQGRAEFAGCENGDEVMDVFRQEFYEDYNPSEGFTQFVRENWKSYMPEGE